MNRQIVLLLLLALALSFNINSDSYVNLSPQGYTLTFQSFKMPIVLNVTGLPNGLTLENYSIVQKGVVAPGQYIISVKGIDANNEKDEKIIILAVGSTFATYNPQPLVQTPPKSQSTPQSTSPAPQQQSASPQPSASAPSSTLDQQTSISSISAVFQHDVITLPAASSTANPTTVNIVNPFNSNNPMNSDSLNNLQNYFNQIDVSGSNQGQSPDKSPGINIISNNLNSILNDFSSGSATNTIVPTVSITSTQVNVKPINLNFNTNQNPSATSAEANALFLKQKLASEYVAGNYSIVLQLTANKNMMNELIANLTQEYQADVENGKNIGLQLAAAVENKTKIDSAISNLNNYLGTLSSQMNSSNAKLKQLQLQKQTLLSQVGEIGSSYAQLSQTISSITSQIQATNSSLASNGKTCDSLSSNLLDTNRNLNVNSIQLSQLESQLGTSNADVANKQAVVDDLLKQLQRAQQALKLAQDTSSQISQQKDQLQQTIAAVNQNITTINKNLNFCNAQSSTFKQNIASLQSTLSEKQAALLQYSNQNNSQSNQINNIQNQIAQETANYNGLQNQSKNAASAISTLKSALPSATLTLQNLVNLNSQALASVQNHEATLNVAIQRFKKEIADLQMANMHLQNARALSKQADSQVNSLLAERGNALPYAVAVDSPQKALVGQTIVNPSINIVNWFNYLTANFGAVAFPFQNATIESLYELPPASTNLQNNLPCPPNDNSLQSFTGKVTSINSLSEIVVVVDGINSKQVVLMPSCATVTSNVNNYKPEVGDSVILKGKKQARGVTIAKNIVFLCK